jgi:hypothetical protein
MNNVVPTGIVTDETQQPSLSSSLACEYGIVLSFIALVPSAQYTKKRERETKEAYVRRTKGTGGYLNPAQVISNFVVRVLPEADIRLYSQTESFPNHRV